LRGHREQGRRDCATALTVPADGMFNRGSNEGRGRQRRWLAGEFEGSTLAGTAVHVAPTRWTAVGRLDAGRAAYSKDPKSGADLSVVPKSHVHRQQKLRPERCGRPHPDRRAEPRELKSYSRLTIHGFLRFDVKIRSHLPSPRAGASQNSLDSQKTRGFGRLAIALGARGALAGASTRLSSVAGPRDEILPRFGPSSLADSPALLETVGGIADRSRRFGGPAPRGPPTT